MGAQSNYYSVKIQQYWMCAKMSVGGGEFSFLMRRALC